MTKRLKRIAPLKFGLVVGIIYGLIALIFIPFVVLGAVVSLMAPSQPGSPGPGMSAGVLIVLGCLAPIFYAVIGGLFGMLAAWVYNVVAKWTGGIEFEVE
jgi:uncharacterized membrane protein YGL010W